MTSIRPKPADIRALRAQAGITQAQAAALVHAGLRTYHRWESGKQAMPTAAWELLQIKLERRKFAVDAPAGNDQ